MPPCSSISMTSLTPAARRCFSTTLRTSATPKANADRLLPKDAIRAPPYPYAHSYFYKQRNEGLYGGAMIQFGNNVSEQSHVKTRRRWHPNIVHKQLYSRALDQMLRLKVRARVLRTIDKVGGLDEYLLGGTPGRIKELGEEGWRLRWAILQTPYIKQRIETDPHLRAALGAMKDTMLAADTEAQDAAEMAEVEAAVKREEDLLRDHEELDIERRMRQRLEEDAYMREQPPPPSPSIWQRLTRPFGR